MLQEDGPEGLGVACITCDRPLSFIPNCYPLVFRCENAHRFSLAQLLEVEFPCAAFLRNGLPWSTLRNWEQRARFFHSLSGCAMRNGNTLMAADFKEAATRFEGWISSLGMLLAKRYPAAASPA